MGLRLFTFAISHFSEKARWALDAEGLEYEERCLLPGAHVPRIRAMAPKTTVPVLVHDRHVVQGSGEILDYIEERLGGRQLAPADDERHETREIEALADHAFGLGVQRICYASLLRDRAATVDLWSRGGPAWARAFYAVTYPAVAAGVRRLYGIRPDRVQRAKERFEDAVQQLDARLAERPFLGGESPNRADITVASLLGPMIRPPEHPIDWPDHPHDLAAFVDPFEGRPTWSHALRMYADHRGRQARAS